ncbi:MAG: hypothetical protein H0V46_05995 [Sphingomonas sp.]|nr:hypothetical protein [Sphingomonas sp.]
MRAIGLLGAAALAAASPGAAQHHSTDPSPPGMRVGEVRFANSGNAAAQGPFLRGLALLHDFEYSSANAAFREAQAADPEFVMAYWGEAMAHNHPLWAQQDAGAARGVLARLGPTPAARAAKARTTREGQWLAAVEALYGAGSKIERDHAYAEQMRALLAADPKDVDARAFRALSVMGLAHKGRDIALYMQAAALLEEAFPAHPDHPGVVHYLIHAYDDPAHAPLGERAAKRYAAIAPDAGHAQHMVSHIYLALGRWPEVELANVNAMRVVNAQRATRGEPASHCGHYVEWQTYAMLQKGEDSEALIDACRADGLTEIAARKDSSVLGKGRSDLRSWSDMAVRQGIETGRWPAAVTLPAGRYEVARFNLNYARLLAARKQPAEAAAALAAMKQGRAAIAAALPRERPDEQELLPWVDRAVAQAEAVVALARGRRAEGVALLRAAAAAEAALPIPYGPPTLQKPSAELLGEALLAAGHKAEAANVFRTVLAAAPGRRLAAQGLSTASR